VQDPNTHASTRPPLSARVLGALAAVERHEAPAVVAAFFLFFCVFAGYFAVRPVRETVGTLLGRDRVADLWIATWAASLAIVPVYGLAVARLRRSVFLPWTYGLVAAALALVAASLKAGELDVAAGQFFYVFISVLNLFLVSVFWSFLLELFDSGQAKRLFPVIAAGGTAGALAGPVFTDLTVATIGNTGILLAGAALFGTAVAWQRLLIALWRSGRGPRGAETAEAARARDRAIGGNPLAGFTIVLRSPYLLGLALFITLLSTANTLLYFEQLRLVDQTFADPETRTRVFARLDWIVQGLTILSQLFLTGRIAVAFGVTALLTIVPLAMIAGFTALAAWNSFALLAVVIVARRFGEYALVRPGREMLWSPLDDETKYKAKNLLDVPVYRGSDALVAQLQRAVENAGVGPQAIALAGAAAAAVWAVNGLWLGRRYEEATAPGTAAAVTPATPPRPVGARS
jgi:AAA family ATP:ADP antiporter